MDFPQNSRGKKAVIALAEASDSRLLLCFTASAKSSLVFAIILEVMYNDI